MISDSEIMGVMKDVQNFLDKENYSQTLRINNLTPFQISGFDDFLRERNCFYGFKSGCSENSSFSNGKKRKFVRTPYTLSVKYSKVPEESTLK